MTCQEIAEMVSVTPQIIYKLVKKKQIPHVRLGKIIRFKSDVIERWLESSTVHEQPS
jgi:excisionase family DNA binding protein